MNDISALLFAFLMFLLMALIIVIYEFATHKEHAEEERKHNEYMDRYRSLPDGSPEKRRMAQDIDNSNWV